MATSGQHVHRWYCRLVFAQRIIRHQFINDSHKHVTAASWSCDSKQCCTRLVDLVARVSSLSSLCPPASCCLLFKICKLISKLLASGLKDESKRTLCVQEPAEAWQRLCCRAARLARG